MILGVYLLILALSGLHLLYYYPQLPVTMATHFDAAGNANGWMSRDGFVFFYVVLQGFLMTLMCSVTFVMSRYPMLTNMPNKKYWLAPERILATVKSLRNSLLLLGTSMGASVIACHQMLIMTSLKERPVLDTGVSAALIIGFVGCFGIFAAWYAVRFRMPRDKKED